MVPARRSDSRLYGRGAVDAKSALATMICAAASVRVPARLVVAGAVEEEMPSSTGAHHLLRSQPPPDAIVIGEPTGWAGIGIGYRGRVGIHLEVTRPAAHSSSPAEKAVEVAIEHWLAVRDHLARLHPGPRLFDRASAALTRADGDLRCARVEVVCRVPVGFDFDGFSTFLEGVAGDANLTLDERTPAVLSDRWDPVVRALVAGVRAMGGRPALKLKTGTSDMNIVAGGWDCPIAAYGPGDSSLDHTDDEHVELAEYLRSIEVLKEALPVVAAAVARRGPCATAPEAADGDEAIVAARLRSLGYLD
jgi:LysW-gamma-L-lysine carboxypeptidase